MNVASKKNQKWTRPAERPSQRAREDYLIFDWRRKESVTRADQLSVGWPSVGEVSAKCRPSVSEVSAECWPTCVLVNIS